MRNYFFDTSAFTRFYAVEPGSVRVKRMVEGAMLTPPTNRVMVSEFIRPETASALLRMSEGPDAARRGLSRASLRMTFALLDRHFGAETAFTVIGTLGLMTSATELVKKHRLKAPDALHLATALHARKALQPWGEFYFVSCDQHLNAAAVAEGLAVLDPTV